MSYAKYTEDNVKIILDRMYDHDRTDIWEFNNGEYIHKPTSNAISGGTISKTCTWCNHTFYVNFAEADRLYSSGVDLPKVCPHCTKERDEKRAGNRRDFYKIVFSSRCS